MGVTALRNWIRQVIQESYGMVPEINEMSNSLAPMILEDILNYRRKNPNRAISHIQLIYHSPDDISFKTKISRVNLYITANHTDDENIAQNTVNGGSFIPRETNKVEIKAEHQYEIRIDLRLNWDFETNIDNEISKVLSHELHHAYTHILKLGKNNKSKYLNSIHKYAKGDVEMQSFLKDKPILQNFMICFYLVIAEEINARVQEISNIMEKHHGRPAQEIFEIFQATKAWRDAQMLNNFKFNDIKSLPTETKKTFLELLNRNKIGTLNAAGVDINTIMFHDNVNKFFKFWSEKFHDEGKKLVYNMTKVFSSTPRIAQGKDQLEIQRSNRQALREVYGNELFEKEIDDSWDY